MYNCGGIEDKRRIVKDIDNNFDIHFCLDTETYLITHKNFPFQRVAWDGFTREVLEGIRHTVWLNHNGNVIDEIEKNNAKIDKDKENKLSEMTMQMAKDIRKPLLNEAYY
jgi:hypothetical protein